MNYIAQIPFLVSDGTDDYPCLLGVTEYNWQAGNRNPKGAPDDYPGWEEISFGILHPDGSVWDEMDLTWEEVREAEQKIRDYFQ